MAAAATAAAATTVPTGSLAPRGDAPRRQVVGHLCDVSVMLLVPGCVAMVAVAVAWRTAVMERARPR